MSLSRGDLLGDSVDAVALAPVRAETKGMTRLVLRGITRPTLHSQALRQHNEFEGARLPYHQLPDNAEQTDNQVSFRIVRRGFSVLSCLFFS